MQLLRRTIKGRMLLSLEARQETKNSSNEFPLEFHWNSVKFTRTSTGIPEKFPVAFQSKFLQRLPLLHRNSSENSDESHLLLPSFSLSCKPKCKSCGNGVTISVEFSKLYHLYSIPLFGLIWPSEEAA